MNTSDRRVLLGEIGRAHGIRGEVLLRSFTADPVAIAGYGPFCDETGERTFEIASLRVTPKGLLARIKGIEDRSAAERLCRTKLYVPRSRLPEPDDGTYYYEDLAGLSVFGPDGVQLGAVVAVVNFGAGDLLEIAPNCGKDRDTFLVPFTHDAVPEVDLVAGRVVVDRPVMVEIGEDVDDSDGVDDGRREER